VATTTTDHRADYAQPGEREDELASAHTEAALDALSSDDVPRATVLALLAIAERISELSCYVAQAR
jgi:hypothetical protein